MRMMLLFRMEHYHLQKIKMSFMGEWTWQGNSVVSKKMNWNKPI